MAYLIRSACAAALSFGLLLASMPASAQSVHKCVKNGVTSFQDSPCDGAAAVQKASLAPASRGLPWDGLRPGMTVAEVKRAVAGVREEERRAGRGSDVRLRKSGIVIGGVALDAAYYFDQDDRLASVIAEKATDAKPGALTLTENATNLADFEKLNAAFRSRYGAETNRELKSKETTGFPGLSASSSWSTDGVKVFVSVSPVTATTSMLSVGYNPVRQR